MTRNTEQPRMIPPISQMLIPPPLPLPLLSDEPPPACALDELLLLLFRLLTFVNDTVDDIANGRFKEPTLVSFVAG